MFISNNKAVSIVGTVFTMLILGIMGAALVAIVATDQGSRMKSVFRERAFYAIQAAFEYALREIKEGGYPLTPNKSIGDATFTNAISCTDRKITAVGMSAGNEATKTHSITTSQLSKDCAAVDVSGATAGGAGSRELLGVTLTKTCLNAVNIDKVSVQWTPDLGEKITQVTIGGGSVYDDVNGTASGVPIDITDYRFTNAAVVDSIVFTSSIVGKRITLTFTFTDSCSIVSAEKQL